MFFMRQDVHPLYCVDNLSLVLAGFFFLTNRAPKHVYHSHKQSYLYIFDLSIGYGVEINAITIF